MSLVRRYLSMMPATSLVDGKEIHYPHLLPLWYYAMVRWGVDFRQSVLAIRMGKVTMDIHPDRPASAASRHLVREEAKDKGRAYWSGNMTNPDTLLFCRLDDNKRSLESLDRISCRFLAVIGPVLSEARGGLLTKDQFASLPDLYRSVLNRRELPVLIFSDAAAEWFDAD